MDNSIVVVSGSIKSASTVDPGLRDIFPRTEITVQTRNKTAPVVFRGESQARLSDNGADTSYLTK